MHRQQFHYELPKQLVAQYPPDRRDQSRLLTVSADDRKIEDHQFNELPEFLLPGDLLVFNDTRVIPARLYGYKASGGRVEVMVERVLGAHRILAYIKASKSPPIGTVLILAGKVEAKVSGRQNNLYELDFNVASSDSRTVLDLLKQYGHVPLPPYIQRPVEKLDIERYQTVYAKKEGAVAAPTAGLHFDLPMLKKIKDLGIRTANVTLHVGAGTFQPVRVDDIQDHQMHQEEVVVTPAVSDLIKKTRETAGRVIAVGTTTVRSLETAALGGEICPYSGQTELFITPGFKFNCVDAIITNFHQPESTLLMLMCAFTGTGIMMAAYQHAIREKYRFFSYGDAMFVTRGVNKD